MTKTALECSVAHSKPRLAQWAGDLGGLPETPLSSLGPKTGATIATSCLETFPSPAAPSSCPVPLKYQVPSPHPTTVSTHSCSYLGDSTPCLTSLPPQHCALPSRYGKVLLMSPKSGAGENFEVIFLKKPSNCFSWETKIFFRILNFVALFTVVDCFYFELDR